jgi:hypothetical protein
MKHWKVFRASMLLLFVLLLQSFPCRVSAVSVMLSGIPAYDWYHGCGPTAAGSVLGYWDLHGYDNLYDASGWAAVSQTSNVKSHISSDAHNAAYDPHPDVGSVPQLQWSSIADWFQTSVNQPYGWSYLSRSDVAFEGYANYRGYAFDSWYTGRDQTAFMAEIDLGNPLMFLVDTDADNSTDHFVPVFGYDKRDDGSLWYACYTTWSEAEDVSWYKFTAMGNSWGVGYMTFARPISSQDAVPEPATMLLLGSGVIGLVGLRRKFKK